MSLSKRLLPYLFRYKSLRHFLADYSTTRRLGNPNWSFGVWAKKLGIANTATLTRILNGDRMPGEKLMAALIEYFEFSGKEREYFEWIALRDKSIENLSLLALIDRHLEGLSEEVAREKVASDFISGNGLSDLTKPGAIGVQPLLTVDQGKLLVLWGNCELESTRTLLAKHGLEPIAPLGSALAAVVVCQYADSNVGAFAESYVAFFSKPIGSGAENSGFFYWKHIANNLQVATFGRMIWGNLFRVGQVELMSTDDDSLVGIVGRGGEMLVRLEMRRVNSGAESFSEVAEYYGFAGRELGQTKYKIVLRATGVRRLFDPGRDGFSVASHYSLAIVLEHAAFKPQSWTVYHPLSAGIYPPEAMK